MIEKKKKEEKKEDVKIMWRPEKYSPEELLQEAQNYFKNCEKTIISFDKTNLKTITKPKTLSWLCLWLKVSKDYISEKAKSDNFSETIKQIRLEVENNIEEWILQWSYNPTSWIFNLKNNFDWKDKTEVDSNVNIKTIDNITIE
jgi:hypothetical protein